MTFFPLNSPQSKSLDAAAVDAAPEPTKIVVVWRGQRAAYDASLLQRADGKAMLLLALLPSWDDGRAESMMADALNTGMRAGVNVQAIEIDNDAHAMPAVRKALQNLDIASMVCWGDWAVEEMLYQGLRFVRPSRES